MEDAFARTPETGEPRFAVRRGLSGWIYMKRGGKWYMLQDSGEHLAYGKVPSHTTFDFFRNPLRFMEALASSKAKAGLKRLSLAL